MKFTEWIKAKIECHNIGHAWEYDSDTLGGDWIKCTRCHTIDEYLHGTHEPRGYHPKLK